MTDAAKKFSEKIAAQLDRDMAGESGSRTEWHASAAPEGTSPEMAQLIEVKEIAKKLVADGHKVLGCIVTSPTDAAFSTIDPQGFPDTVLVRIVTLPDKAEMH